MKKHIKERKEDVAMKPKEGGRHYVLLAVSLFFIVVLLIPLTSTASAMSFLNSSGLGGMFSSMLGEEMAVEVAGVVLFGGLAVYALKR